MGFFDRFRKKAVAEEAPVNPNGSKILVVDDAVFMRDAMRKILEENGYQVTEAEDGEEAVAVFRANRPDLVLMDVTMPRMDGLDACVAMRNIDLDVPVIICASEEYAYESFTAGAEDFLLKPFPQDMMLRAVKCALEGSPVAVPPAEPSGKKILIVDPSASMRAALKEIINGIGQYDIAEAEDGRTAVEMFEADRPGAVFAEMHIPVKTGLEICREMKEIDDSVPVVITTFEKMQGKVKEALHAGAKDYILKPYNPDRVGRTVKAIFG